MHPRLRLLLVTVVAVLAAGVISAPSARAAIDAQSLGARRNAAAGTITFRVYSATATRIAAYVYSAATGAQENVSYVLTENSDTFSATVTVADLAAHGVTGTVYYGYRAWGPNWPYNSAWTKGSTAGFISDVDSAGNRFNPNKLLIDPYAREISHDPRTPGHTDASGYRSGANRAADTGTFAPKGIVLTPATGGSGTKPTRAFKDDIVYEVHLRGLTRNDTSIAAAYRGTYRGAGLKAAYLASLGVTAVEFLPVQETQNDTHDVEPTSTAGDNYWGYMTLNYFAPDRRYSSDKSPGGPTAEFQAMVKAYHDAGIKVLIDVVYNHTGEEGPQGDKNTYNLFSWRGLDNPTYYSLTGDRQGPWDNTGVGGNYNTANPVAQNLIVDSVAYWKNTLGVDGFRFDLASVLGNTCQHGCFNYNRTATGTALNRLVAEMPARPAAGGSGVDWIAEPWAIGGNSYQVGNFPAGWSEWNGIYRDTVRRDQNKLGVDAVTPGDLANRFAGSSDLYGDDGRRPWNSINFVVAHDGFTLKDLYSCSAKNNDQAWPYGPSDGGSDDNISWNQGGVAGDQRKAARNGQALLTLSAGTPMMTGGDEHLRGINCNNNPYNVDSSANWLGWAPDANQANFATFTGRLLAFRKAHPALRPANFYTASDTNGNGLGQLVWFTPAGTTPDAAYWADANNHALAWRIDGSEFGDSAPGIYVAYNGWSGDVTFTLPAPPSGKQWYRVTDTSTWAEGPDQVAAPGGETLIGGASTAYALRARGLLLLIAK
ncbi:alpha-amylase family glycosyl hydrolase [Amorphoplanes digitatis]|uniref:Glycogen operon protein n=1 Tax=Actinoplanes digitatis TaxID=1868 RepID=A0A7W7MQ00_9ACTN|nr:isoamylase [Actinoplanes digitatis]MBB4761929.1 glycogen operon protein [Actinoplanes digitatis]GID91041.1 glycogen operon protein GlgX homolog [Actinoplanes digitatis]